MEIGLLVDAAGGNPVEDEAGYDANGDNAHQAKRRGQGPADYRLGDYITVTDRSGRDNGPVESVAEIEKLQAFPEVRDRPRLAPRSAAG